MVPPRLPESFVRRGLAAADFVGWETWAQLRSAAFATVPTSPAVYVVYRPVTSTPEFLKSNPGGRFKGKDPTVDQEVLTANWVQGANVVYIGKADNARRRLAQFARFGAGEPVGHWGGRLIWHLADSDQLLVAWHPITWDETARDYERRLLGNFVERHNGQRPLANLTG